MDNFDTKIFTLPPVRKIQKPEVVQKSQAMEKKVDRIRSCDYAQWDKYDPGIAR